MATVKISLFKVKTLKDGSHPIYLVITIHRVRKKFNLNRSCHSEYWDSETDLPGKKYPKGYKSGNDDYKKTNLTKYLETRLTNAKSILLEFEQSGKEISFSEFENKFQQKLNREMTVFQFFEAEIDRLKESGQVGYAVIHKSTLNAVKTVYKKDLPFNEITQGHIQKFIKHYQTKGTNGQSISVYLRTFRTVIKKAIEQKLTFDQPIDNKFISNLEEPTRTKGLTLEELKKLLFLDLTEYPELVFSRDIFFLSFYLQGMSFSDLAEIRYQNIDDRSKEIIYRRRKTGKPVKVALNQDALSHIEKYRKPDATIKDYILPILNKDIHQTEQQIIDRIKKVLKRVNGGLQEMAQLAGIDPNITSYWSRHSFAMRLLHGGNNIMIIKQALGHSDLATTQKYLKGFDDDLAEATSDLLGLREDKGTIQMSLQPKKHKKAN